MLVMFRYHQAHGGLLISESFFRNAKGVLPQLMIMQLRYKIMVIFFGEFFVFCQMFILHLKDGCEITYKPYGKLKHMEHCLCANSDNMFI
jgi:hypothetical protein